MEKISNIIPPSTRQTWISGEIEKPRRVADPVPGDSMGIPRMAPASPFSEETVGPVNVVEGSIPHKGTRLNTMA